MRIDFHAERTDKWEKDKLRVHRKQMQALQQRCVASSKPGNLAHSAFWSQKRGPQRPALLQHTWPWPAVFNLAGSYRSFPGPNSFLPCFPISHLTAFLNDQIGKLFSKATINYSISSISQPLEETVQSFSISAAACCVPRALYQSSTSLGVSHAGSLCLAPASYQCDMNI